MTLLQPSFRGRLRLFFAVIVVVPIIAIGVVLFRVIAADDTSRLDARLSAVRIGAANLYKESRDDARRVGAVDRAGPGARAGDRGRRRRSSRRRAWRRWRGSSGRAGCGSRSTTSNRSEAGTPETAIAAVALPLEDSGGQPRGQIIAVDDDGRGVRASSVHRVLAVQARVDRDGTVLASTMPAATGARMRRRGGLGPHDRRSRLPLDVLPRRASRTTAASRSGCSRRSSTRTRRCRSS